MEKFIKDSEQAKELQKKGLETRMKNTEKRKFLKGLITEAMKDESTETSELISYVFRKLKNLLKRRKKEELLLQISMFILETKGSITKEQANKLKADNKADFKGYNKVINEAFLGLI